MPHIQDLSGKNNLCYSHGHALRGKRTSTYQIWEGIKKRCLNPKCKAYPDYGGRGITLCDRWLSFENFLADMGERPESLCIERIDNDKGYSPDNCVWASRSEQAQNKRNVIRITAYGETRTIAQWSEVTGLTHAAIYLRLRRGATHEEAVTK